MPYAAARPCKRPGCPALTRGRFCEACQAEYNTKLAQQDDRPSPARRGYDHHWRQIRANFLRKHPVCSACPERATEVDHQVALAQGGSNRDENLQAFCRSCHSRKTAQQDGGFGHRPQRGSAEIAAVKERPADRGNYRGRADREHSADPARGRF